MNTKITKNDLNYDSKFYLIAAAGIAGLFGGCYLLYSLLSDEDELDDKELIEIEELKHDVETNKGTISKETAMQILYMINHHAEVELKKLKPGLDKRRREAFNNENDYKALCQETLEAKEIGYNKASEKILREFGTNHDELNKILSTVDPHEMERKLVEFEKSTFEEGQKPDSKKTKEAFLFYGNKFLEEMQGLSSQFRSLQHTFMQNQEQAQEMAMFNLIVTKMKVEDLLYMKYSLTETQIRCLINEYNLNSDRDIQNMNTRIASLEEMMGGQ